MIVAENLLNREFKEHGSRMVLLTDITYMVYGNAQKAYLSSILDAYKTDFSICLKCFSRG